MVVLLNALRDGPLKELTVDTSAKQKFTSQFILCRWEMGRKETGALLGEPAEPPALGRQLLSIHRLSGVRLRA